MKQFYSESNNIYEFYRKNIRNAVVFSCRKFGPLPSFPMQRVWARSVIVICAAVIVYFSSKHKETVFASQKDFIEKRSQVVPCSDSYKLDISKFGGKCNFSTHNFLKCNVYIYTLALA